MAGGSNLLTDTKIRRATERSRLRDGAGLWLNVTESGSKAWVYRWTALGKTREMGLGGYPVVSLADARAAREECRAMVAKGIDPRVERKREVEPTFRECADRYIIEHEPQWKNDKHRAQWRMTLGSKYCGKIENLLVSQIGIPEVLSVLEPIWLTVPETASRLRGRIERILGYARVKGWRNGDNPAMWRGNLSEALPKPRRLANGHFPAMAYKDVPEFFSQVRRNNSLSARAMELLLYTCCRSGEVLNARWEEVDFENSLWIIPAVRTKTDQEYQIPLTVAALDLLERLYQSRISEFVFPGQKRGRGVQPNKPLSAMALEMLLRRMKVKNATPHGFRSSFRDWAGDKTDFPREVAEGCLNHKVGNAVEQAYRRGSAFEKRSTLLENWCEFLMVEGNV